MKIERANGSWGRGLAVALTVVGVMMPGTAEAQLGSLTKRAKDAAARAAGVDTAAPVADENGTATASPTSATGHVLTITPAVLDRLLAALDAELAEHAVVEQVFAQHPTPEARATCEFGLMQGPEGQKVMNEYMAALEKAGEDQAALMKAMQAMDTSLRALYARECGELLTAEEELALQQRPHARGAEAGSFTTVQYAILKERILPFCEAGADLAVTDRGASVPGVDPGQNYVYGPDEIEAIRPRCTDLVTTLAALA